MKKTKGEKIIDECKGMPDGETHPFIRDNIQWRADGPSYIKPPKEQPVKKKTATQIFGNFLAGLVAGGISLAVAWVIILLIKAIIKQF